jgi:hypothetical protein
VELDQTVTMYYRRLYKVTVKYVTNEGSGLNVSPVNIARAKTTQYVVGTEVNVSPVAVQYYITPAAQTIKVTGNKTFVFNYDLNIPYFLKQYTNTINGMGLDATHKAQFTDATAIYYNQMKQAQSLEQLQSAWKNFKDVATNARPVDLNVHDKQVDQGQSLAYGMRSDQVTMYKDAQAQNSYVQRDLWRTQLHAWFTYTSENGQRFTWVSGAAAGSAWIENDDINVGKTDVLGWPDLNQSGNSDAASQPVSKSSVRTVIGYDTKTNVDLSSANKVLFSVPGFKATITGYTIYHNANGTGDSVVYVKYKADGYYAGIGTTSTNIMKYEQLVIGNESFSDKKLGGYWNATEASDWVSYFSVPGEFSDDDVASAQLSWDANFGGRGTENNIGLGR